MKKPTLGALFLSLCIAQTPTSAAESKEVFVDPINGSPKGTPGLNGSIDQPFKSMKDALDYAEIQYNRGSTRFPYTIQLRAGVYDEVLTRSGIKGAEDRPIVVQAYEPDLEDGQKVTFDGTLDISDDWEHEGGNIYSKYIGEDIWQLFVNEDGQWQEKMNARWPNARFGDSKDGIPSVYSRDGWAHANTSGNANGLMVDDSLASDSIISGISLKGAIVVANVGSFDTWTREITVHEADTNTFEYNKTVRVVNNQKHYYYFVQNKKELLDNDDEWYFDKDTKTAYLYSSTGTPSGAIRAKKQPYAIRVGGWEHVTVRNLDFFATTLRCGDCENFTLEDSNFEYGGSSRRALGENRC